jgi:hypothetical protein
MNISSTFTMYPHATADSNSHLQNTVSSAIFCLVNAGYRVPNVVHYVYGYPLANKPMTFLMYISFLSVQRFIRPRYIFIHGDALPHGEWWNRTTNDVDNIYFVNMTSALPTHVFGMPLRKPEHVADVVRMDAIYSE